MSSEKTPECAKCGESMHEGFTFDTAGYPTGWMEGVPRKGFKLSKGPKPLPVTTFRCPTCGYLESYAPSV